MAITETVIGNKCNMLLNNGTDTSGNIKTVTVSLGTLSGDSSAWDASKAVAIVEALAPCLTKSIYSTQHVSTTEIEDDS